jgi:CheY-like chemotaxis protein
MAAERTLDDSVAIRTVFQRLYLASVKITLAYREQRGDFQIISLDNDHVAATIDKVAMADWKLVPGEKISVNLEDRGFKYEAVVDCQGTEEVDGLPCARISMPRTLRRSDSHRLADFAPDSAVSCTFSNSRSSLIDAQVKGFGMDGLELTLRDPRQRIQEALRMGEESTIEVPLDNDLRMLAPTRVAYFGDTYVGLKFTEKADKALIGQYQSWLENQQRVQTMRDRESLDTDAGRKPLARGKGPELPPIRVWVDRDPMILVITEKEEFARRMAEGMGRKFGVLSLDYIKGRLRPFLGAWDSEAENWGRVRLVLIHNHLRLVSPLELTRQIVEQEQCPVPVVMVGSEEDESLKRNRAIAAGAVDYIPIEPFRILQVLRKIDETIRMFEG